jgi:hypothetical protein
MSNLGKIRGVARRAQKKDGNFDGSCSFSNWDNLAFTDIAEHYSIDAGMRTRPSGSSKRPLPA